MSLRKAINLKCKDCVYDSMDKGGWKQQVDACTSYSCSLYPVRPRPKNPRNGNKMGLDSDLHARTTHSIPLVEIVDSSSVIKTKRVDKFAVKAEGVLHG
jgi:hypothetical protein